MIWHPKPRKRTINVRSTRTAKQPHHWVQDGDRFVLAAELERKPA